MFEIAVAGPRARASVTHVTCRARMAGAGVGAPTVVVVLLVLARGQSGVGVWLQSRRIVEHPATSMLKVIHHIIKEQR